MKHRHNSYVEALRVVAWISGGIIRREAAEGENLRSCEDTVKEEKHLD
jgi:hypothetical protein